MTILIIDLETTGLPETLGFCKFYPYTDIKKYDNARIVQLAMSLYNDTIIENKYNYIIKPSDFTINNSNFHGITNDIANNDGIEFSDIIDLFNKIIDNITLVVGHNILFDINVLASEVYRYGDYKLAKKIIDIPKYCTMKHGKEITNISLGGRLKYPKLTELCTSLGIELKKAHDAFYDMEATTECYFKMQQYS